MTRFTTPQSRKARLPRKTGTITSGQYVRLKRVAPDGFITDPAEVNEFETLDPYERRQAGNEAVLAENESPFTNPLDVLDAYAESGNLALVLPERVMDEVTAAVREGYAEDEASMEDWRKEYQSIMGMAANREFKAKDGPIAKSNANYPLISTAAINFAASAGAILLPDNTVAHADVPLPGGGGPEPQLGPDATPEEMAQAEADMMERQQQQEMLDWASMQADILNRQHFREIRGWASQTDRLLTSLAVAGSMYRWRGFDPVKGFVSELIYPDDLIVHADYTGGLEDCPRYSWRIWQSPVQIRQGMASGAYREMETLAPVKQRIHERYALIRQYCFLDLDGDGFEEPYCVTFAHEKNAIGAGEVLRIDPCYTEDDILVDEAGRVRSIERLTQVVKYDFLPNFEGKFHGTGLGILLRAPNDLINTLLNQIIDAGRLANTSGGFVASDARFGQGVLELVNGRWISVPTSGMALKDAILPNPHKEPSGTLFAVVEFLIGAAERLASMETAGFDSIPANMGETTALSIMQQGAQVKNSIIKRITAALQQELDLQCLLNRLYGDEETAALFEAGASVRPVADPDNAGALVQSRRAQVLMSHLDDPLADGREIRKEIWAASGIRDADRLLAKPQETPPEQQEMMRLEMERAALENQKIHAEAINKDTSSALNIAKAEAEEAGAQLDEYAQKAGIAQKQQEMEFNQEAKRNEDAAERKPA